MEEVGAQVASPIFIHPTLGGGGLCEPHPMLKKRSLAFLAPNFQQQQSNYMNNWNPKLWDWDSVRFVAKPLDSDALTFRGCGGGAAAASTSVHFEPLRRIDDVNAAALNKSLNSVDKDDDERLRLKLGGDCVNGGSGGSGNSVEEPVSRPNKRVRSGSPGGSNNPMCQVDNCKEDLSGAKDYHRRHKVCEIHSKATRALVGKQMQRFCQQCSRFHPLSEFDEGKRSCRRRLAGHNRRRRKTQPEDVSSRLMVPGNNENNENANVDLVNLLKLLARAQGSTDLRGTNNYSSLPNKDQLIHILGKLNSSPLPEDLAASLSISGSLNRTVPGLMHLENQHKQNEKGSSPSTMDLLAVLSTTSAAPASDGLTVLSQKCSKASETERTKSASLSKSTCINSQNGPAQWFPSLARERSSCSNPSPVGDSDCRLQENHTSIPLQLFSSSTEDLSPPKLSSSKKYFSSDSSNNPLEDRSPSSSPPVVKKLFPMQASRETVKPEIVPSSGDDSALVEANGTRGCVTSLDLFGGSNRGVGNGLFQSFPFQSGYTSSSGSDHSPSSLNSDSLDHTGRISFKLFDKDPSQLPGALRDQVYKWLSHSPSEMESYIRPGCVVLSIYISMPCSAWEQLEENFLLHVNSLVQISDSDFWRYGRFLLHTGRQLALHDYGKVRLCRSLQSWKFPELISVSPLAVVGGQEATLLLRGRNLNTPGNKIYCTHASEFTVEGVKESACQESTYDEITLAHFRIYDEVPSALGRCFVEVENASIGNSFPLIIADAGICRELRLLESELNEGAIKRDDCLEENGGPLSKEEVLHFLNELGWLFQRKGTSSMLQVHNYTLRRFKFLLIFSVERDFCALVKTILDMLVERNLDKSGLSRESLDMLSEIHLLNRAVKRRCRNMIDLLIHYFILSMGVNSRKHIFLPNLAGPGGVTALHLVACMSSSDDLVDLLTSDPLEVGLHCWNSLLDTNGLSPFAYSLMRKNQSYNSLVTQKLSDRKNCQVSLSIESEIEQQCVTVDKERVPTFQIQQGQRSCSKCSVVAARYNSKISGSKSLLRGPFIHSLVAVAAVCVCVCLFLRGSPNIGLIAPFKWENLDFGTI